RPDGGRSDDDHRSGPRHVRDGQQITMRSRAPLVVTVALALASVECSTSMMAAPRLGVLAAAAAGAQPATSDKTPARPREERGQPVTVDSDKMERFGKESLVVFTGNAVARQN